MPITVLSDVVLPNSVIAAGVRGKNMRSNSRVVTDNGFESVNVIWSQTLRQYELGIVPMRVDQWQAIETIHEITDGGAYGFLMMDPKDQAVTAAHGVVTNPGSPSPNYQLYKRYIDAVSGRQKDRKITRPLVGGITVYLDGVALAPGAYNIDGTIGNLTFSSIAPAASRVTWSGSFYVPVHFVDDSIDWELVTGGAADTRFLSGPLVVLQEVRE